MNDFGYYVKGKKIERKMLKKENEIPMLFYVSCTESIL